MRRGRFQRLEPALLVGVKTRWRVPDLTVGEGSQQIVEDTAPRRLVRPLFPLGLGPRAREPAQARARRRDCTSSLTCCQVSTGPRMPGVDGRMQRMLDVLVETVGGWGRRARRGQPG